jgi:phage gp45-like
LAETTDPRWISVRGMVRRMVVSLTDKVLWQLTGVPLPDDNGGVRPEVRSAEVYSGIGFYSRPPKTGMPEAVVLSLVGDASAPVVAATRDEKTRAEVLGDIDEDETAMFNSKVALLAKADGTIEVGAGSGTEPTLKGNTYRGAEDTLLSAFSSCLIAINAYAVAIKGVADPANAATPTLTAALQTMNTAIATFQGQAASYLSRVAKVR